MKRLVFSFLLLICFSLNGYSKINIVLIDWDKDSFFENGFRDEILSEFKSVRFYSFSCNRDKFLLNEYVKFIKRLDVDLIFAVGYPVIKVISESFYFEPVIFVTHYDPVDAGLVASYKNSENNLTGVVAKIPILQQLKTLRKIKRYARLGIVKSFGDFEYKLSVKELKRLEKFLNYKTVVLGDITDVVNSDIDALYIFKSQHIDKKSVDFVSERGVLTLAADANAVEKYGVLLSLVVDEYRVGRIAGKQAVKVMKGKKPAKIPVIAIEHFMLVINMKTAKKIGVQIPLSLLIMTDKIIK